MSRWERERVIHAEYCADGGELMLSASDVIAWLRDAVEDGPSGGLILGVAADHLASMCFDATRSLVDGGEGA